MDTQRYKKRLLEKEQDLLADISRLEAEARNAREAEVEDPIDVVTADEGRAAAFQESTIEWQTLTQVRDALRRIDEGTYGKCIDCGRDIEPARLEAVPWTPYCLQDQEKHDRKKRDENP
jgi:DnaK suppressor protein